MISQIRSNKGVVLGALLAAAASFYLVRRLRARAPVNLRPHQDAKEGLALDPSVDPVAAERAVRAVGLATWT
jgi:hypothetical protein